MGCDIHFVVEALPTGEDWVGVFSTDYTPNLKPTGQFTESVIGVDYYRRPVMKDRNYQFFGALAGVRVDGPEAKGLPDDVSALTAIAIARWDTDGHSHSWDTLDDFAIKYATSLADDVAAFTAILKGERQKIIDDLTGTYHQEDTAQYRVIYWFDN
jgi:hypothetical protein